MMIIAGNYNGIVNDEFTGPDSYLHYDVNQFGASWQLATPSTLHAPAHAIRRRQPATCRQTMSSSNSRRLESLIDNDNEAGAVKRTECKRGSRQRESVERYCNSTLNGSAFTRCQPAVDVEPYVR